MSIEENLQSLAIWDLQKNKDYYSADAMDKESCFYNSQIGNCGTNCISYILGKCPIEEEILED